MNLKESLPKKIKKFTGTSMKLFFLFISVISIFLFAGCSEDNKILVSTTHQNLTRGQLKEYYRINSIPIDSQKASIQSQTKVAETLVLRSLVFKELGESITEDPDYKAMFSIAEKQLVTSIYQENFSKANEKNQKFQTALIQFIYLKGEPNVDKKAEALSLQKEINSIKDEKKIFDFISQKTDEKGRKPIGGFLEPICTNCNQNPLSRVFKEGIDSNSPQFFVASDEYGSYYIYRVKEKKELSFSNFHAYLKEKFLEYKSFSDAFLAKAQEEEKQFASYYSQGGKELENKIKLTAEHYQKEITENGWKTELEKIQTELGLTLLDEVNLKEGTPSPETVLFQTPNYTYTYSDLQKETSVFEKQLDKVDPKVLHKERMNFFYKLSLPSFLLTNGKEAEKIRSSEAYQKKLPYIKNEIALGMLHRKIASEKVDIPEADIRSAYEAGKLYTYIDPNKSTEKQKVPLPYAEVRDRIKQELTQNIQGTKLKNELEAIKKKYSLKVHTENFKEGEL
jgi:hypothetical protein